MKLDVKGEGRRRGGWGMGMGGGGGLAGVKKASIGYLGGEIKTHHPTLRYT